MYRYILAAVLGVACTPWLAAGTTATLPDPPECRDYQTNSAGAVDDSCNEAIAREADPIAKSVLLFRRAYVKDATHDFSKYDGAIADLTQAINLYPRNWAALHERAYLYNELGRWKEAIADLNRQIALVPNDPRGYQERAMSRFSAGDLEGSYEDRDTGAKLEPRDAGSFLARARAELWLGRFDAAHEDIDTGRKLADSGSKQDREFVDSVASQLETWQKQSGSPSPTKACLDANSTETYSRLGIVGDCTVAFLSADSPSSKAAALTQRAEAWLFSMNDKADSLTDSQIAVALDPTNAGMHSNLGFAYIAGAHSWAAEREFDKAIEIEPSFFAYAGRAEARYNQSNFEGAFADAKKSFEIKPNELALTVLGDLALERLKDAKAAKQYWMGAYHLGDRDDGLKERLHKVGVSWPPPEESGSAGSKTP